MIYHQTHKQITYGNHVGYFMQELLLFSCIRNELNNINWFINHYKSIGVTEFHIIDNGSTDGTRELLDTFEFVNVYDRSQESFKSSKFGITWLSGLRYEYGRGKWCLFVDADEMFVYPGYPDLPLTALFEKLERRGQRCMWAPMIDMFNAKAPLDTKHKNYDKPELIYPHYLSREIRITSSKQYPYVGVRGGAREFFFGSELKQLTGNPSPNLRKIPLTFCETGDEYITVHVTEQLPLSDITAILLHYKINGYLEEKSTIELERKEHYKSGIEYKAYNQGIIRKFQQNNYLKFRSQWLGVSQLYQEGLVSCPKHWKDFLEKKGADMSGYTETETTKSTPLTLWPSIALLSKNIFEVF